MSLRGDVTLVRDPVTVNSPINIAGNVTVYSQSFRLNYGQAFGIALKAASAGVIALQIQLEQSDVEPTTQGSADANWVVGDGVADIITALANNTKRIVNVSPIAMKYGRLKIIGGGSNDASTTLTANLFQQELIC